MQIFTFWHGSRMTYIERICLSSMLATGHSVDLYAYDQIANVPAGIAVKDARAILPEDRLMRHAKSGSFALFTDMFRYEGLRRGAGIWSDCDMVFLRNLGRMNDPLLGWEDHRTINAAVLFINSSDACLKDLFDFATARVVVAPFWSYEKQLVQLARAAIGRQKSLEDLEWGIIGPKAITHFVKKHDLLHKVQPVDVFYPIHWRDAKCFWMEGTMVEDACTSSTRAIHLWNKGLRRHEIRPPPPGSFIARLCQQYDVQPD